MSRDWARSRRDPAEIGDEMRRSVERAERAFRARWYPAGKRLIDICVSAVLLIILAVPMALIALVVATTSRGPALFKQIRLGRDLQPFVMFKFRSMYQDADDEVHRSYISALLAGEVEAGDDPAAMYKLTQDERVTRVGAFLRRMSLDELPQLWNVLGGSMSLVGPRPALPYEADLFGAQYRARFEVKPGLTGLWQVSGRSHLTMPQALELDEQYVRERCLTLDLWILLRTIPVALLGRGAS